MFRIVCFGVIICVTSFIGNYFSVLLRCRLTALKKIDYMIEEIIMLLRYRSATVYEILDELRHDSRFDDFDFLEEIPESGVPFQQGWSKAAAEYPVRGLTESDTELLCDVGARLGVCDAESQLGTLELQRAELSAAIRAAETDYTKKAKLYRSMGVLAGAFISIMLI